MLQWAHQNPGNLKFRKELKGMSNGLQNNGLKASKKLILSYDEIVRIVEAQKVIGKIIIFLSGTWDLLHIGHCRYFRSAIEAVIEFVIKNTGRAITKEDVILIVGVDNDAEVKVRKGEFRPIVPQEERMEMLTYLEDIKYVVLKQETEQSWALAEKLRPDYLILSESTTVVGSDRETMITEIKTYAGEVIVLPPQAMTSTTGKIRTLLTGTVVNIRKNFDALMESITKEFHDSLDKLSGGD